MKIRGWTFGDDHGIGDMLFAPFESPAFCAELAEQWERPTWRGEPSALVKEQVRIALRGPGMN